MLALLEELWKHICWYFAGSQETLIEDHQVCARLLALLCALIALVNKQYLCDWTPSKRFTRDAVKYYILSDAFRQICMEEGEEETSHHFHLYCPAFARLRLKYIGKHTFGEPGEVAEINVNRLNKFVIRLKLFAELSGDSFVRILSKWSVARMLNFL